VCASSHARRPQTCSQFAFYQTCEKGSKCPYTQGLNTLASNLALCKVAFGIDGATVAANVEWENAMSGGDAPRGTRIAFPNGQIDPWHASGVLVSPDPAVEPTLMVKGSSHHFWTHPSKKSDAAPIVAARQWIWNWVTAWLKEE
jgi:serine protease 16